MLKYVKRLDTSKQFGYLDQFLIIGKNSCLVQKNGQLKSGLFKSLGVLIQENYGAYDLHISIEMSGTKQVVVEYGLTNEQLGEMLLMLSRHGSIDQIQF